MRNFPFQMGSNVLLGQVTGSFPNLSGALTDWFHQVQFITVQKVVVNFEVYELLTQDFFQGVVQPLSPTKIMMKPEGQRNWIWKQIHATPGLILQNDDIIYIDNLRLRVAAVLDFSLNGYMEYHAASDYQDVATAPPFPNEDDISKFVSDLTFTTPLVRSVDVSATIPNATNAIWGLFDLNNGNAPVIGAIQVLNSTTVIVTAPAAGRYRLIGAF